MLSVLDRCEKEDVPEPSAEIVIKMAAVAAGLYGAELLQPENLPTNPALFGTHAYTAYVGHLRDWLLLTKQKAEHPVQTLEVCAKAISDCFFTVCKQLPFIATDRPDIQATLGISLLDVLPNVPRLIEQMLVPFDSEEAAQLGLFRGLHRQLKRNVERISELPRKKNQTKPTLYEGTVEEIIGAFLQNTVFDDFFDVSVPFELPEEQRYAGHWIIAPAGRGKTTLLHSMFLNDLERNASIIVLDSKGDLIGPIKELQAVKDRLILIEPDPDYPLALNPLDIPKTNVAHTISLLEYIFSALLEAKMTALQMTLFRSVLPALVEVVPDPTLDTFRDVIENGMGSYRQYIALLPRDKQEFFKKHFDSKTYAETRQQLIWRLQFLMTNPVIKQMFSALKTKLDIGKEMDAGKIILIDNGKNRLGDEGSEFFGRFFIALVLAAAQQRAGKPQSEKVPCYFYIDECQNVIKRDEKISTILDECRSQKIAMIMAHQRTAQITNPNVLDALSNCAIRMANSDDEAKYLSPKLRCEPEFLYSLPRGTFATFVRDLTPQAVALDIPYVDLNKLPKMTDNEQRAIRERMRKQYGVALQELQLSKGNIQGSVGSAAAAEQTAPTPAPEARESRPTPDTPESGTTW